MGNHFIELAMFETHINILSKALLALDSTILKFVNHFA